MRNRLALAAPIVIAALWLACGGGDGVTTPTPSITLPAGNGTVCAGDLGQGTAATHIFGAGDVDYLADRFSLAAGDFNDDGFDDALIGAPLADGPGDARLNAGEAYVIFGSETLPAIVDIADGAPLTVYGAAVGDNLGLTVAAGDVNGDGIDDIVLGSRFASVEERDNTGKTYVIFGSTDLPAVIDAAEGDPDVTIIGVDPGDFSGISVTAADVTGDGIDDLIIGATSGSGPEGDRARAGEVHVVVGSESLGGVIDLRRDEPFFTVYGAFAGDALANFISAGDINGDGRKEILLGAPMAEGNDPHRNDAGEAYIIPVPPEGGTLDLRSGEGFTRISGASERDLLGHFVASADVNGDGIDDAIISARDADGLDDGRNNAGEIHVLYGRSELPDLVDLATDSLDVMIVGPDVSDSFGFSVATGDLNGDGFADILGGAPIADGCENAYSDGGDAYAVFGGDDLPAVIDLAEREPDVSLLGPEAGDELGFSVAMGDFNGDGKDDIIVGALLAEGPDNDRPDAGEAYIVLSP
ncbi:MAG: FG-GAP repeat protein [Chloroflexi bacterium]|nr:FG-GAP repeat protein [Chloroflexota bacterium]